MALNPHGPNADRSYHHLDKQKMFTIHFEKIDFGPKYHASYKLIKIKNLM